MRLSDIAYYVDENINSDNIELNQYVTTDSLLQNKEGRTMATNLPPQTCSLTHYLPGDVLVANIRPYLKKVWKADIEGGCSKDVLVLRAKEGHHPDYLYALTLQDVFFDSAMLGNKGTQMPRGNKDKIMELPLFEQTNSEENIGRLINKIQDKIILNTRMNAELEAMAKQLYDFWFVQFDFPNENGKPYKSSGGKMVWNEKLKREIPEGWEVKSINQLANGYRGVSYTKDDLVSESKDSVLVLRGNNIPSSGQFVYDGNVAYIPKSFVSEEQKINKGDIIITMSSGSKEHVGKCFMFQDDSTHTFGAFISKFTPKEDCRFMVYQFMLSDFFKVFVRSTCNGTGINNLTNDTFNNALLPYPPSQVLKGFECMAGGFYKNIGLNQKEIVHLTSLRDSLFPMLMNGQVEIKE